MPQHWPRKSNRGVRCQCPAKYSCIVHYLIEGTNVSCVFRVIPNPFVLFAIVWRKRIEPETFEFKRFWAGISETAENGERSFLPGSSNSVVT